MPVLSVFLAGTGSDPRAETPWGGRQGLGVEVTKFGGGWRCSECPAGCPVGGHRAPDVAVAQLAASLLLCAEQQAREPLCGALGEGGSLRKGPGLVIRAASGGRERGGGGGVGGEVIRFVLSWSRLSSLSDQCLSEEGATS